MNIQSFILVSTCLFLIILNVGFYFRNRLGIDFIKDVLSKAWEEHRADIVNKTADILADYIKTKIELEIEHVVRIPTKEGGLNGNGGAEEKQVAGEKDNTGL